MRTYSHSPRRDGFQNRVESYVLTHFKGLWDRVQQSKLLSRKVNRALINHAIYKLPTRPFPLSTFAPYTSWQSLTDRTFTARHLPPTPPRAPLPPVEAVADLFERRPGREQVSRKSTVLFSHFAQWFTDGFLRTVQDDVCKNTSPHEIDLCQLYGLNPDVTGELRSGQGGRLKSQIINGEEYPCFYYNADGQTSFKHVPAPLTGRFPLSAERKAKLFALGVERANVQVGYVMMNTLFLREHNRICALLTAEHPAWDDDRLFHTARNIVIVLVLKIVIEEYINHIAPYHFKFRLDAEAFPNERWYRQNWMSAEFSLVYRWHGLVPDQLTLGGQQYPSEQTLFNNSLLTDAGLGPMFEDASRQPAGDIHVFNTPRSLRYVEIDSIQMGRDLQLASYNDYRELAGFPRVKRWDEISGDPEVQQTLKRLYKHVDNVEFYTGLFAEDVRDRAAVGALIGRLVGIDAFSQALTNPLLNPHIFNEQTFSASGLRIIEQTQRLSDIVHRNIPATDRHYTVSMTRLDALSQTA